MSSPAALFLSAFAASSTPDEEATVAGYTLGPVIGYGATSTIRKAYNDADSITAVKIIRISDLVKKAKPSNKDLAKVRRALLHEESIWASLSHEHILPLFTAYHTPAAFYFFTLYCPAGSLFDILKRDGTPALLQDDAGMMFRQVVRGLRYLHEEARLVHRDIKLENVLVDEMGLCKIADFGTAKPISPSFYQRSSPASVAVSRSQSRSVSRSRPCDVEELSEPDLEKDWVDESQRSTPATPNTSSSTSSSTSTSDDELASQSYNIHRASSLTSPRPSHLNRFHRNSTTSYTHSLSHSHTLPPSSSYPTTASDANFRNHNNTKPKSKSKHTRFQPGSLPYAAPELLLLPHPAAAAISSVQVQGHAPGHRNKSRSRSKSANRNGNSNNSRKIYAKKSHNHHHGQNHNRYQPHPGQDIWALGVLLYTLLAGKLPFSDRFEPRLQMKILSGHFIPPPDIGRGAERILYGCLDKNVQTRWTIAMVDEVAWGVGWGREGDEVVGGGSDDEGEEAFGAGVERNGNGTSGVPPPHPPYASAADAKQSERCGAAGVGFISEALASGEEPSTQTKTKGADGNAADAFLYDTRAIRSVNDIEEYGSQSRAHAVTFVDEPEGVEIEDDDLHACFDDTEEEAEEEENRTDSPEERGRGRKGLPLAVPIPRTR